MEAATAPDSRPLARPGASRPVRALTRPVEVDLSGLRWPGAAMLAAGVALPLLGHPGGACPLRTLTGIPCPLCGMSTSVEDAVRLRVVDAFKANPGGLVVAATALLLLFVPRPVAVRAPVYVVYLTLLALWMFELFRFRIV